MSFPGEQLISTALSSGMTYVGAREANRANKKMAREQMSFQKASNREQMAFQERMSNTAYQRSMQDMKAAGINPILAYNQGGASTPGGASSGGASATMQNEFAGAVSSALDARRASAEVKNLREQNKQIQSQTKLNQALAEASKADAILKQNSAAKTKSDTFRSWVDTATDTAKTVGPWLWTLFKRFVTK